MLIYNIINGPMVWFSFSCFFAGIIYQVMVFYSLSKPIARHPGYKKQQHLKQKRDPVLLDRTSFSYRFAMFRLTIFGRHPSMMILTTIFHLTLILTPFFILGHNVLLDRSIGISFPILPENIGDFLAMLLLACCLIFLLRKLFIPKVRAITTVSDLMMLLLTVLPFLTGFLAHHHVGDYDAMILAHMVSGEILIMVIPFTRFIHMIYFFINRYILIHQNNLCRGGSRVWR